MRGCFLLLLFLLFFEEQTKKRPHHFFTITRKTYTDTESQCSQQINSKEDYGYFDSRSIFRMKFEIFAHRSEMMQRFRSLCLRLCVFQCTVFANHYTFSTSVRCIFCLGNLILVVIGQSINNVITRELFLHSHIHFIYTSIHLFIQRRTQIYHGSNGSIRRFGCAKRFLGLNHLFGE